MIYTALRFCLYAIGLLWLLVFGVTAFLQTQMGKGLLASELSRQLSSRDDKIEISDLDGFLPLDMRLGRVQLADRDGTWLQVDGVRFDWSPSALLRGRLHVTELRADRIEVVRAPLADEAQEQVSQEPLQLPELPKSLPPITVDRIDARDVVLGASLLGRAATLALDGTIQTSEAGDLVAPQAHHR